MPELPPDVRCIVEDSVGRVVLDRPAAINALTLPMVAALRDALDQWRGDDRIEVVTLEGAGAKGLCAGGDMRAVRMSVLAGTSEALDFFTVEYAVNAAIGAFPKPVVAFADGIVMGGGVGLAGHASRRLTTSRTRLAMPETAIGFFCDVGGSHLLARAPGQLGTYLAMTGLPVGAADAVALGLADAVVSADAWPRVLTRLREGGDPLEGLVETPPLGPDAVVRQRDWIDECFAGDSAAVILARLEGHRDPRAREAGRVMRTRSPLSVCVVLEQVRRAATMSLEEVLALDLVLAKNFLRDSDMAEGVRDVLVDKGRGAPPAWRHTRVEDVPEADVQRMFCPL